MRVHERDRSPSALATRSYDIHVGPRIAGAGGRAAEAVCARARAGGDRRECRATFIWHAAGALGKAGHRRAADRAARRAKATKSFAGLEKLSGELLRQRRRSRRLDRGAGRRRDRRPDRLRRRRAQARHRLRADPDHACWRRWIPRSAARPRSTRAQGKNLIGLFHQPRIVIADTALLATLPQRELLAGYAEVVKYGALGDARFLRMAGSEWRQGAGGDERRDGARRSRIPAG